MTIKRWLSQQYIGDQLEGGVTLYMVTEGEVEMENGDIRLAWILTRPSQPVWQQNKDGAWSQVYQKDWGITTFEKPRIDKKPGAWPAFPPDKLEKIKRQIESLLGGSQEAKEQ